MLFWFWVKDKCDHAGIWKPNISAFQKITGKRVDLKRALELFNSDKKRVLPLSTGKWLLVDFVRFQYGAKPNENNRVHASVIKLLNDNDAFYGSSWGQVEVN